MRRILYFSTRYPAPISDRIKNSIRFSDAASAVVFSDAIFQGLVQCGLDFENINFPPIGYWPKMNRDWKSTTFRCEEGDIDVWNLGTVNFYVYQNFSLYWQTYNTMKRILKGDPAICLVYAINVPTLKAILKYRKKYAPKTKVVLIIPDLIEDMYNGLTLKSKLQRWMQGDIESIYSQMDGFVYLTEQMREKTRSEKPYCIVEGIYDHSFEKYNEPKFDLEEKVVFYSGKLEQKFGARLLVDAFCKIPDAKARLVLCGSGDSVEYVQQRAAEDKRIIFKGQIPRDEVLRLQAKARLLVNPRTPEGEFTKYSFPSKNIQYLASGIPTLIYRLEGIPNEYYGYCLSIDGDKLLVDDLAKKMQEALAMSIDECKKMGKTARQFVVENKNACVQGRKIIDLINKIE